GIIFVIYHSYVALCFARRILLLIQYFGVLFLISYFFFIVSIIFVKHVSTEYNYVVLRSKKKKGCVFHSILPVTARANPTAAYPCPSPNPIVRVCGPQGCLAFFSRHLAFFSRRL
ncbi:unnamed protein product, partial [Discosporangium mesarthrocarpum]